MATGSILEITTKITSQTLCETIVSALRGVFVTVMPQDEARHHMYEENIVVQEAI